MGLKITVEDAKCVQANAFIQEAIFHHYVIKEEQLAFKINLTVLLVKCPSNYNRLTCLYLMKDLVVKANIHVMNTILFRT